MINFDRFAKTLGQEPSGLRTALLPWLAVGIDYGDLPPREYFTAVVESVAPGAAGSLGSDSIPRDGVYSIGIVIETVTLFAATRTVAWDLVDESSGLQLRTVVDQPVAVGSITRLTLRDIIGVGRLFLPDGWSHRCVAGEAFAAGETIQVRFQHVQYGSGN